MNTAAMAKQLKNQTTHKLRNIHMKQANKQISRLPSHMQKKKTKFIINLFKNVNAKIVFRTANIIGKQLLETNQKGDKHDNKGVYKLKCTI
jgi:hypothetical protein